MLSSMSGSQSKILLINYLSHLTGVTLMELTTSRMSRTSTSLSTAVHAGPKPQLLPYLIELKFSAGRPGPTSTLHHKFLFLANKKMMDATAEMPTTRTNGFIKTTSQMKLAQFTKQEVMITESAAARWLSVVTVNQVKPATYHPNTTSTASMSTVMCTVKKPWWMSCTNVVLLLARLLSHSLSMTT